jgi:hypothetical protein
MKTLVKVAALAFASPAIAQSSCGRPDTVCLQVQRTPKGAAFSTPTALPKGHLEAINIGSSLRASEWRGLMYSCRDLLRGTAPADAAQAKFREGCMIFGVRRDSTDAELDAIKSFGDGN